MRKFISFVLFILYDYYKDGKHTKGIAYEQAILIFLSLVFINLLIVLAVLNLDYLNPISLSDPRWLQYLKVLVVFFLPGYLFVTQVFKKDHIINLKYDWGTIWKGRVAFGTYFILSFVAAVVIGVIKHGWHGMGS